MSGGLEAADVAIVGDGLDSDQAMRDHIRAQVLFDDRPAPGTRCALCDLKAGSVPRHYCPAKTFLGEYPVCAECARGELCGYAQALERMHSGAAEFEEFEAAKGLGDPGHRVELTEAVAEAPAPAASDWKIKDSLSVENLRTTGSRGVPGRMATRRIVLPSAAKPVKLCAGGCLKQMSGHGGTCPACWQRIRRERAETRAGGKKLDVVRKDEVKRMPMKVSDEVRAAIKAAPASVKTCDLVKQYGVSYGTVFYIRKPGGARVAAKKAVAEKPSKKAMVRHVAQTPAVAHVAESLPGELVTLQVPGAWVDQMLASLDLANKARAIQFLIAEGVSLR